MKQIEFKEKTNVLITDPCYVKDEIVGEDNTVSYNRVGDYEALINENTIYGDWSCFVYQGRLEGDERPGNWDEMYFKFWNEYNFSGKSSEEKKQFYEDWKKQKEQFMIENNVLGEFCADSGRVAVFNYDKLLKKYPCVKKFVDSHPWCATVVKDFAGTVEYYVRTEKDEEGKEHRSAHIIGTSTDGSNDFFTIQSGL